MSAYYSLAVHLHAGKGVSVHILQEYQKASPAQGSFSGLTDLTLLSKSLIDGE